MCLWMTLQMQVAGADDFVSCSCPLCNWCGHRVFLAILGHNDVCHCFVKEYFISIPSKFMHYCNGVSHRWADYSSGSYWSHWGTNDDASVLSESSALVSGGFYVFVVLVFGHIFMG